MGLDFAGKEKELTDVDGPVCNLQWFQELSKSCRMPRRSRNMTVMVGIQIIDLDLAGRRLLRRSVDLLDRLGEGDLCLKTRFRRRSCSIGFSAVVGWADHLVCP